MSYSPNGSLLALAFDTPTLQIWDLATGKPIRQIEGHESEINCAAFSPDGKQVATGGNDGTIRIWNLPNGLTN